MLKDTFDHAEWDDIIDRAFHVDELYPQLSDIEDDDELRDAGGAGSGNFGHAGRPGEVGGSASGTPSVGALTTALKDAKTGHTQFEKETGPDEDWAGWYADFVSKKVHVPTETLKPLIVEASKIHTGEDWPEKYAEYIVEHLQPKTLGGAGSGNFGHAGRPGEVGGSAGVYTAARVIHEHGLDPKEVDTAEEKILAESTTEAERKYSRELAVADVMARESLKDGDTKLKHTNPDGTYTDERLALHKEIAQKMFDEHVQKFGHPVPEGLDHPTVTFFAGMPGAGKSTAAQDLVNSPNVIAIDADRLKSYLPEYKDGIGTAAVVRESNDLADAFMVMAAQRRMNIVIDGTMKTSGSSNPALSDGALGKMAQFKDMGYRVETRFVDISVDQSVENAMNRFHDQFSKTGRGRYVPPHVTRSMADPTYGTQPRKSFELAKNTAYKGQPLIDAYVHVQGFTGDQATFGKLLDSRGTVTPGGGARE